MLLSLSIGDIKDVTNEWGLTTDSYGNTFIFNESIRQRIRLGKNVKAKLDKIYSYDDNASYKFASNTFLSNNNKNMNLSLMNFWSEDKDVIKNHKDDHVAYITLSNSNYKLINYTTNDHYVVQTYHKNSEYQGLAIMFKDFDTTLLSMSVKDLQVNKYCKIDVVVDAEGNIKYDSSYVLDQSEISIISADFKKLNKKMKYFVMNVNGFPTNTFIVNSKYKDDIEDMLKDAPDPVIIVVDSIAFSDKQSNETKESLREVFNEVIVGNRVRAITTVGVKIPFSFLKEYSILYLFNYDVNNNRIECFISK